jgi:DUF4097 and DUF4098 domain-containing protein YvlB
MGVSMTLFLALFFSLSLKAEVKIPNTQNFPASAIKSILVSVPKGRISLSSSNTQKDVTVNIIEANKIYKDNKKCLKNVALENSQLNIKISSENILFEKADCNYDVMVVVPSSQVFGMDVSSGSALIVIKDVAGVLNLKTITGSVSIDGDLVKNVSAKTATGNMSFSYKTCSSRADLDFLSATGKTTLNLPADCKIRVDYKSATGKLFNALGESQDYEVMITAKSVGGDFNVVKR